MAMHDKPEPLLNRLICAHAEIKRTGAADFVTSTKAKRAARQDGKVFGKHPDASFFVNGFDMHRIRQAFEGHAGPADAATNPHPFLWILELKLKAVTGKVELSSAQLTILRELEALIQACASVHPEIAEQLEQMDRDRDQRIQGRWGSKRVETGPTPFEEFTGGKHKAHREA